MNFDWWSTFCRCKFSKYSQYTVHFFKTTPTAQQPTFLTHATVHLFHLFETAFSWTYTFKQQSPLLHPHLSSAISSSKICCTFLCYLSWNSSQGKLTNVWTDVKWLWNSLEVVFWLLIVTLRGGCQLSSKQITWLDCNNSSHTCTKWPQLSQF